MKSPELITLLENMQDSFSRFQNEVQLSCPPGCGACCLSRTIEASPKEMLPLALHILEKGEADHYLKKLEGAGAVCIHYQSHSEDGKKGQCGVYAYRPSVCRMFGVAGQKDKEGGFRYSVCSELKNNKEYEKLLSEKPTPPLMEEWAGQLLSLDPELITRRMPINLAFKEALERVLLYLSLSSR